MEVVQNMGASQGDLRRRVREAVAQLYAHGDPTQAAVIEIVRTCGIELRADNVGLTREGIYIECRGFQLFVAQP